jgi:phenylalanyl-tRNA synthetase beta chain
VPAFAELPRQQAARRDLALVVPDRVTHDQLVAALMDDPSGLIRSARLFDVYRPAKPSADVGEGERSLAVRLELLDDQATLTDERIDAARLAAAARATERLGARLRG